MEKDIIVSGVHLTLTEALKQKVHEKAEKLFRHGEGIVRIRVELQHEQSKDPSNEFVAKGHVEIHGPDIIAVASSDDLYKSIDLLVQKLDRQLTDKASREKK
ncbi:MAG: ribosome-associated translation inhibitor RaiA [Puniceicoccales bacterium]|jgi:putative sigma-54 modulation protein|nr:ribosome-associated translation inhibitor RaiA [Puniceicoccales bacterium]